MFRVVFDTNVFLSALMFRGSTARRAYELLLQRSFILVFSPPLASELARKLREFGVEETTIQRIVRLIAVTANRQGGLVRPVHTITRLEGAAEPDNRVLECAIGGAANIIVSGDRHLLRLKEFEGISIIRLADFLRLFPMT